MKNPRFNDPVYRDLERRALRAFLATKPVRWEPDPIGRDEARMMRVLGADSRAQKRAIAAQRPYPTNPAGRGKRYREMDDDEFDDVWSEARGSSAGIPL